jgi:hypothetical protein
MLWPPASFRSTWAQALEDQSGGWPTTGALGAGCVGTGIVVRVDQAGVGYMGGEVATVAGQTVASLPS